MDDLLKLAKKEKLTELESAWLTAVGEGEFALDQMLDVPEVLAKRGHADTAESLLWFLVDSLLETDRREDAFEAAHRGALLLPDSSVMREFLTDLYVERPDAEALIRATIGRADTPLDEAVERLDRLMRLEPGTYVLDPHRGEAGRVVEFDPDEGALLVEFAEGERSYGPAFVTRLEPLEPDDFRALSTFERDRLVGLAKDDPEELLRVVLSSLDRRMAARRLRLYLEPIVGSWRRWWSGARDTLRRSSIIGMTEGNSPSLFLRKEPLSHGERLLRRLEAEREPLPALALALDALRQADEHMEDAQEVAERVAQRVASVARDAADDVPLTVAAHAVLDVAQRRFPGLELPEMPPLPEVGPEQGAELADELSEPRVLTCALEALRRREMDGWAELFAAALPHSPRPVCRMIAERLAAAGETSVLAGGAGQIISRPDAAASAGAWLWGRGGAGQPAPGLGEVGPVG
ncbi:MAG: hypothetical protein R6V05_04760, partial [Candidatus Brocadiia bacterium]